MLAMDWKRIREGLRDLRIDRKMSVPELATDAGIAKTTVYRLEDLSEDPDRGPDLETIEKLTTAMGLTLSEFFLRIEGLNSTPSRSTVTPPPQPNFNGAGALSSSAPLPLDDVGAVIAGNSAALVRLARTLDRIGDELVGLRTAREQTASAGARASGRSTGRRKTG